MCFWFRKQSLKGFGNIFISATNFWLSMGATIKGLLSVHIHVSPSVCVSCDISLALLGGACCLL